MPRRSAGPSRERWADPCRVDKDDDDEPQCRSRNLAFGVGPLPPWSDPCEAVLVTGTAITAWHLSLLSIVWSRRVDTLWREALGKKGAAHHGVEDKDKFREMHFVFEHKRMSMRINPFRKSAGLCSHFGPTFHPTAPPWC